jgi:excisionase family DNA binding protein
MERTAGTYRPGVSIHEAAVMLGVSPTTVRRWVASGKLRSQRFVRPQGEVVRVFVGLDQLEAAPAVRGQVSEAQVSVDAPPRTDEQVPAGGDALAAWSEAFLAPLVAELAASRETIAQQAETIGLLRQRLAALEAPHAPGSPPDVSTAPAPRTCLQGPLTAPELVTVPWWKRWLLAVYG